jgi:hypothetical protein
MKRFLFLSFTALFSVNFVVAGQPAPAAAEIECTTPDGRVVEVQSASAQNPHAPALLVGDDTLTCPLQEGDTTFIIKLSGASFLDRFNFVNQNASAAGRLKISVSNDPLPVTSPKWIDVDGNIDFNRKRLFNVSTVGVEARYVKLSFRVAKTNQLASVGL